MSAFAMVPFYSQVTNQQRRVDLQQEVGTLYNQLNAKTQQLENCYKEKERLEGNKDILEKEVSKPQYRKSLLAQHNRLVNTMNAIAEKSNVYISEQSEPFYIKTKTGKYISSHELSMSQLEALSKRYQAEYKKSSQLEQLYQQTNHDLINIEEKIRGVIDEVTVLRSTLTTKVERLNALSLLESDFPDTFERDNGEHFASSFR